MRKSVIKQRRLQLLWTLLFFGVFTAMIHAETVCAAPQKEEVGNNTWYESGSININVLKMVDGDREDYISKKLTLFRDKAPEWNDCITNSYKWKTKMEGKGMLALSSNEHSTFKEYSIDESYTPIWQPSYLGFNGFAIEGTFTLPEGYKFNKNSAKSSTLLSNHALKMHLKKDEIDKSYEGDQTCSFLIALHACQAGLMTSEKSKYSENIIELVLEPNQTDVVYDSNGGVGEVIKQTITYGEKAETKANLFSKTGYILTGWKDEKGNLYDLNQDISCAFPVDKQITLYAHWQKKKLKLISRDEKKAENKLRKMGTIKIEKEMKGLGCVVFTWEAMDSANGYKIYRATSKSGKYSQIYNCPATDDSSIEYINGNLKNGKVYYYKIRPYQRKKSKIVYGKYSNIIVDKVGKPKVVVAENIRGLSEISWDDYYNADGFLIYKKINKGKWKLIKKLKDGEHTYYSDKKVKHKQKYKYKVRAFKGKTIGPFSNVLTVVGK